MPELPGVMVYGQTREEAIVRVEALALRVIADCLDYGEPIPELDQLFAVSARVTGRLPGGIECCPGRDRLTTFFPSTIKRMSVLECLPGLASAPVSNRAISENCHEVMHEIRGRITTHSLSSFFSINALIIPERSNSSTLLPDN